MPSTYILIECADWRVANGQEATRAAIRVRLGDNAVALHNPKPFGPSPLLAGTGRFMPDGMVHMVRAIFMYELIWCINHIEKSGCQVDYIIVAGHDEECAAECGDDLRDPGLTNEHLAMATLFVCAQLEGANKNGQIRGRPEVLGIIQHIEGDTIVSVEFFD